MSFLNPDLPGDDQEVENPNAQLAVQEGGYDAPDVEADADAIQEEIYVDLAGRVPGWAAHDGNLDTWLIEDFASVAAEIRALAADVPASIFTTYGSNVLGIPPEIEAPAVGEATFTASDEQGYTIPIGTTFALPRAGDDLVAFATTNDAMIAPGSTSIGSVPFAAVEPGSDGSGLSGAGQMLDPLIWVASVQVDSATYGGSDAESPDDYLDRLTNLMRMVALRPILPQDFAILALQNEGVGRAVALNLYDPATGTWDNERTVTLILADAAGLPIPADLKQRVVDQLEALREVNWVVNVIDPTYDAVDVDFAVTIFDGQDQQTVLGFCVDALMLYLAPASWRLGQTSPAIAGGEVIYPPDSGMPARRQVVRINELIALLDGVRGVDYVETVTINGAAADHELPDVETLPQPGSITGVAHGGNPPAPAPPDAQLAVEGVA